MKQQGISPSITISPIGNSVNGVICMVKNESAKPKFERASDIHGYDIELNKKRVSRIDSLVNNYEKRVTSRLDEEYEHDTKQSDRVADKVAAFGGSWAFIIIFALFLILWILVNALPILPFHFDPQPFILLNLILSFIAAFQAPIIMMSQNRQAARDKHESLIDFAINYKSEQEVDDMQAHLHRMEKELSEIKQMLASMQPEKEETEK